MPRHANSTNRRPRAFVWCKTLVKDGQSQLFCASLRKPHATRPKHFRLWRCPRKTNLTSVVAETFAWFLHFILDFLNWWPSKSFPAKIYECTLHQHAEQKIWQHRPFFTAPLCSIIHLYCMHSRNKFYCKWQSCIQNAKTEFPQKRAEMNLAMSDARSFGFCCWKTGFTKYTFADLGTRESIKRRPVYRHEFAMGLRSRCLFGKSTNYCLFGRLSRL